MSRELGLVHPGFGHVLAELPLDRVAQQVSAIVGEPTPDVRDLVALHVDALAVALTLDAPELLADQQRWQANRLEVAGGDVDSDRLDDAVRTVLGEHVDPGVLPFMDAAYDDAAQVPSAPGAGLEVTAEARAFLDAALAGPPERALRVVHDAVAGGRSAADIMLGILQPAQVEVGRLWEAGGLAIADERRITTTTQLALAALYPQVALSDPGVIDPPSLVAAAVGAEAHDLGLRIITDLMETQGWRTAFLGATVPPADLVKFLRHRRPDVLAVSTTMARHLLDVRDLVAAVRADPVTARVKVLVGGQPFARHPRLARLVGADATARTPEETMHQCRSWAG